MTIHYLLSLLSRTRLLCSPKLILIALLLLAGEDQNWVHTESGKARHGMHRLNSLPSAFMTMCVPVSAGRQALLTHSSPMSQSSFAMHSTQVGGPAASTQLPPAWQIGAEPGRGYAPLLQVKEQLLPAVVGVLQLKVPELAGVISELAGG